jgi:hypothetical protein
MLPYLPQFCNSFLARGPSPWQMPSAAWCTRRPARLAYTKRTRQTPCRTLQNTSVRRRSMSHRDAPTRRVAARPWCTPWSACLLDASYLPTIPAAVRAHPQGWRLSSPSVSPWGHPGVQGHRGELYTERPPWFEEKCPRGLGRSAPVVWGEVPPWFEEKCPRGLRRSAPVV